ncbi:MAG: hypothetical protein GF334_13460 [Candidatus Altiarchaeales archaeon]|nr:hypothetical protein [Candidatus Altiarchaeales archaeon]
MSRKEQVKLVAENDLEAFIKLVQPKRVLGNCHRELIRWWTRQDALSHQLILMPRDHQKSALAAFRVAWEITKNPAIRILYISATSKLAVKQLKFIKDILTSDIYRFYWPEMVNEEESKREKWTETEVAVDHPMRKAESVRDPTIFTAGLTTTITGLHCDLAVLDDVVVEDNAYSEEGRNRVETQVSYLASITGTDSNVWVVGTRYHPLDLYGSMMEAFIETYDDEGNSIESAPLYEVYQKEVEDRGDGTGNFLWPRQQRIDGKWFGFNTQELAKKKAQYYDKGKFRAQYYNDPNDYGTASISRDMFQYYNRSSVKEDNGFVYYKDRRLNLFAAMDFAYSLSKRADYTCIVVIGVDAFHNYYVLDIDRFKTNLISEYFSHLLAMYQKWGFRKIRLEVTAAQSMIVKDLEENYIRTHGLALSVDPNSPRAKTKEERIEAALQPKYANKQMWHFIGGNCDLLEEELLLQKPPHDDLKDCLTSAIEISVAPARMGGGKNKIVKDELFHPRFGGIY